MWLLNTTITQLKFFSSSETIPPYAILLHVWSKDELLFQDLGLVLKKRTRKQTKEDSDFDADSAERGEEWSKADEDLPRFEEDCAQLRRRVGKKVWNFCEIARKEGFQWVWADMCCIDKTSSAELSEAINSMFDYYSKSSVCYVYLEDVDLTSAELKTTRGQAMLHRSKWHRRGWTLQELIAPPSVILLSSTWAFLGSKYDLAGDLYRITGVPASVLRMEREPSEFSIAQRMSWAAWRETTRPEDEAYCLLGIFGIHIPTLYGEGRHAFYRLQLEIMRTSPDTTLFAWGRTFRMPSSTLGHIHGPSEESGLLAASPAWFLAGNEVICKPQNLNRSIVTFNETQHGIHITNIPVTTVNDITVADFSWTTSCVDATATYPDLTKHSEPKGHVSFYLVLTESNPTYPLHNHHSILNFVGGKRLLVDVHDSLRTVKGWQLHTIFLTSITTALKFDYHTWDTTEMIQNNLMNVRNVLDYSRLDVPFHILPHFSASSVIGRSTLRKRELVGF